MMSGETLHRLPGCKDYEALVGGCRGWRLWCYLAGRHSVPVQNMCLQGTLSFFSPLATVLHSLLPYPTLPRATKHLHRSTVSDPIAARWEHPDLPGAAFACSSDGGHERGIVKGKSENIITLVSFFQPWLDCNCPVIGTVHRKFEPKVLVTGRNKWPASSRHVICLGLQAWLHPWVWEGNSSGRKKESCFFLLLQEAKIFANVVITGLTPYIHKEHLPFSLFTLLLHHSHFSGDLAAPSCQPKLGSFHGNPAAGV